MKKFFKFLFTPEKWLKEFKEEYREMYMLFDLDVLELQKISVETQIQRHLDFLNIISSFTWGAIIGSHFGNITNFIYVFLILLVLGIITFVSVNRYLTINGILIEVMGKKRGEKLLKEMEEN